MILQAIKFAILGDELEIEKSDAVVRVIPCEILLFLWWLINFAIINALGSHLSAGMIIMEVLYTLVTLWFFVIIILKALEKSSFIIVCNPLVIIIGFVIFILLLLIAPMVLIFIGIKH